VGDPHSDQPGPHPSFGLLLHPPHGREQEPGWASPDTTVGFVRRSGDFGPISSPVVRIGSLGKEVNHGLLLWMAPRSPVWRASVVV
jgi:hypothetical protein